MHALILAGGYGRRLYPITKAFPKPLLLVNKRPIIDYIVEKLEKIDQVDKILVVTNNKFISLFRRWGEQVKSRKPIEIINDRTKTLETRLGALGDINFVIKKKHLKDDLLIIGGDNLFDQDLNRMIAYRKKHRTSAIVGVFDIRKKSKANQYGVVAVNKADQIIHFEEKPKSPKSSLVAMCLYYFPKEKISLFKEYMHVKGKDHDAAGSFISWLHKKSKVFAFVFRGRWYDIGGHDFYREAQKVFS